METMLKVQKSTTVFEKMQRATNKDVQNRKAIENRIIESRVLSLVGEQPSPFSPLAYMTQL